MCAAASAGVSLTPSPTSNTRRPVLSRSRTALTLSCGSRPARASRMPTSAAKVVAAGGLSPVSSTGVVPVSVVNARHGVGGTRPQLVGQGQHAGGDTVDEDDHGGR
ncbi:MAG: hypothetical protein QOI01_5175 [Mycobacterium sp.]|nr:hypothetical protein [Mycobacterium sp.]